MSAYVKKLLFLFIFIIGIIIIIVNYPDINNKRDFSNYSILLIAYLVCVPITFFYISKKNFYIFEPFTLVTILYLTIMIFQPMVDIVKGNYYCYGKDIMDGCIKGTIIFIISFISFYIGYRIKTNRSTRGGKGKNYLKEKSLKDYRFEYTNKVRLLCIALWFIGFLFAILFYYFTGRDPINAISLGILHPQNELTAFDSNVKFLMKLAYFMIIPWVYILYFDRNKSLKVIITFLMFLHFIAIGSRIIIIVCAASILLLPYVASRKSISFPKLAIFLCILLFVSAIIAFIRGITRQGGTINLSGFSMDSLLSVFDTNFTIYKAYYAVVESIPQQLPYQMGKGFIVYTFLSFIPSIIFPYKRRFDNVALIISTVVNNQAALSGVAYINLGQLYAEFGAIGCFICMFIFGVLCRKMNALYEGSNSSLHTLILYCVLFPFLMQIITRGDIAQQVCGLFGLIFPFMIISIFSKNFKNQKEIVLSK